MTATGNSVRWLPSASTHVTRLSVAELQTCLRQAQVRHLAPLRLSPQTEAAEPGVPWTDLAKTASSAGAAVAVMAAHSGAGASTVAVAIADAAGTDRPVRLVEWCRSSGSGLGAATVAELGDLRGGAWRRGSRDSGVTIIRPRSDEPPDSWPELDLDSGLLLADLGHAREAAGDLPTVVVCRATVPGIQHAERLLAGGAKPIALVVVGPARWAGAVRASAGHHVRMLQRAGRIVSVPFDTKLGVCGVTSAPLPKAITAAGRELLCLIDGNARVTNPSLATSERKGA
jgi:hypothetical protein